MREKNNLTPIIYIKKNINIISEYKAFYFSWLCTLNKLLSHIIKSYNLMRAAALAIVIMHFMFSLYTAKCISAHNNH